jgi:hypothetical protein
MAFFFRFAVPVLVGLLVACLVLPLRFVPLAHSNQTVRRIGIFSFALLAFFAFFVLTAYVDAYLDYALGLENTRTHIWAGAEIVGDRFDDSLQESESVVIAELWVRKLIPPDLRRSCDTQNQTVCTYADTLMRPPMVWLGKDPLLLVQSLLSALVSGIMVTLFTRYRAASLREHRLDRD